MILNIACKRYATNAKGKVSVRELIPKVIHYVWLGKGEKSELIRKCIDSWERVMPNWEIKEWNEENFPMNYNKFFCQA